MNILISYISGFIEKLPNAELRLEPFFCRHAVQMVRSASASSLIFYRKLLTVEIVSFQNHPEICCAIWRRALNCAVAKFFHKLSHHLTCL
jgi:hypothetical protein